MSMESILAEVAAGKIKPESALAALVAAMSGTVTPSVSEKTGVVVVRFASGGLMQAHIEVWRALLGNPENSKVVLEFCKVNETKCAAYRAANGEAKKAEKAEKADKPNSATVASAATASPIVDQAALLASLQALAPKV